jgi:hypothetical protein
VVILGLAMVPAFFVSVQAAFNRQTKRELRAGGTDMRPGAQTADLAGGRQPVLFGAAPGEPLRPLERREVSL